MGRATGMLEADLDALEAAAAGYTGAFKIQLCGPWTLAASLDAYPQHRAGAGRRGRSGRPGRVAGRGRGRACGRRTPPACLVPTLVVQFDEPALPGVLAGSVPTASGLRRVAPVDAAVAADRLHEVLSGGESRPRLSTAAPPTCHGA